MDSNEAKCAYQQAQNPGRILGTAEGMGNACAEAPRSKTIRTQVEIPACHGFGTALEHLKRGGKVTRHNWNGKGMWLELQRPDRHSKMTLPYVFLCYPTDVINPGATPGARVPWLASQTDMLAEDWAVLPD